MRAQIGDRIIVESSAIYRSRRSGEIVEVFGPDEAPPYRVRWSDGEESIIYPGPDVRVEIVSD